MPELEHRVVRGVAIARQKRVEHQQPSRTQAVGREFEDSAQLSRRPKIWDHLGKDDQLVVAADPVHGLEDVAVHDAHLQRFALGLRANDLGELRAHLHRVHRVAAPRQSKRIATGPGADVEHRVSTGIGHLAGQGPHPGVWLSAEKRPVTAADPAVVVATDRHGFGCHAVVHPDTERGVERDHDVGS